MYSDELRLVVAKLPYINLIDISVVYGEFVHKGYYYWPVKMVDGTYHMIIGQPLVFGSIDQAINEVDLMESLPKFCQENNMPFYMYDEV